ncbi:hypothetical protein AAG570_003458 [Ranatra chinensis]|uniref:P-type ATPase A domain-containing protein n=1 Tax=Ranatra chinensis TaxID=642074 RepID=A0ABD0YG97_9HEMI
MKFLILFTDVTDFRVVCVKKLCYVWVKEKKAFFKLAGIDENITNNDLHNLNGYSKFYQNLKRVAYGWNEINLPIHSIPTLFLLEVLNPFYFFQIFTLIVWICDHYYYYSIAIIIMSVFGISSSVIQTHRNQTNLHHTIHTSGEVMVKRDGMKYEEVPSKHLVPGDVIVIPSFGCVMQCDAVLLQGNCIVNESTLTGESVPVTKTSLPKNMQNYGIKEDANHTLFCGTHVLQTRYYSNEKVHAVVIRTGFYTVKGDLVRSMLYPPPADFKFDRDSYKFIWILATIGTIGFIYTLYSKSTRGLDAFDILIKALDLFTIVIPVALPAAMTVGKIYALSRLKKQRISCINSRVINVSGSLNCVCFDKTGTLTEDGLDMWGVISVDSQKFMEPCIDIFQLSPGPLLYGMVSCHSLTLIDGKLTGDPLEVKMFESTGWILEEPVMSDSSKYDLLAPTIVRPNGSVHTDNIPEIGILHQFHFSSSLQRMSVVTRQLGSDDLVVYCKGSPEMIKSLSDRLSVPGNFYEELSKYTEKGFRVLAIASKKIPSVPYHHLQRMLREEVECNLTLAGIIVMENKLKPQTAPTVEILKSAKIKLIMITGDNIQTAISIARESGLLDTRSTLVDVSVSEDSKNPSVMYKVCKEIKKQQNKSNGFTTLDIEGENKKKTFRFATTGKHWAVIRDLFPQLLPYLLEYGSIFARMTSEQKQQVVVELQKLGYCVAMCGDGTNDCGALKAANVGISLSEAEASVASPFTSQEPNISCVTSVIREGRAALITSFGVFKFMVLYSLTEFMSTLILYNIDSNLTDFQFLYIDIALVINFAFFFGKNEAFKGPLVPESPATSILSFTPLVSMSLQVATLFIFQMLSYILVKKFPWYEAFTLHQNTYYVSYENFAVFSVSQFQYIILAIVFSRGQPYRTSIYHNRIFFLSLVTTSIVCIYITLYPANWVINILELKYPPNIVFPLIIILLAFINFLVSLICEKFVVDFILFKKIIHRKSKTTSSVKDSGVISMDIKKCVVSPSFKPPEKMNEDD